MMKEIYIGGIYIGNDIIINDGYIFNYINLEREKNISIKAGGSITIKKGNFFLIQFKQEIPYF